MKVFSEAASKSAPLAFTLDTLNTYTYDYFFPTQLSIFFIQSGRATVKINNESFPITAPTIICLNEKDYMTLSAQHNLQGKLLTFSPSLFRESFNFDNIRTLDHSFTPNDINIALLLSIFVQRFPYYKGYISIAEPSMKQLVKLVEQLSRCSHYNAIAVDIIVDILKVAKRLVQTHMCLANVIITETSFEVKDVLMYLHNNCKQKITIPILSKQFHVNRTTLSDRFFEATGETIITYLNKYRINLAALMLRESNYSISDIAEEVGFNDTAYFAKLFKKYMLHTPSGYRQHYFSLCQVHKVDTSEECLEN